MKEEEISIEQSMKKIKELLSCAFSLLFIALIMLIIFSCSPVYSKDKQEQSDAYILQCEPNQKITIIFSKGRNIPCTDENRCDDEQ